MDAIYIANISNIKKKIVESIFFRVILVKYDQ